MRTAPQVVVGREPWSGDFQRETLIGEDTHRVLGWVPWMESLRDRVRNPRLFLVMNRESGRFTVCHWVWGPGDGCPPCVRLASEVEGFEGLPGMSPWPTGLLAWNVLVKRMEPATERVGLRAVLEEKRKRKAALSHETMERREETARRFQSKGMGQTASLIRRSPFKVGAGQGETVERVSHLASSRVSVLKEGGL